MTLTNDGKWKAQIENTVKSVLIVQTISCAPSPLSPAGGGPVNPEMEMKPLES